MAQPAGPPATDRQELSDQSDIDEDLWTSASKSKPQLPRMNAQLRNRETSHGKQDARDEALRKELQIVRKVNEAIEGAIGSLAKARNSMKVTSSLQSTQLLTVSLLKP